MRSERHRGAPVEWIEALAVHLLGNAVVPPVAEWIARRLQDAA